MGNQDFLPLEVLPTCGTLEWPVLSLGGLVELELGPVGKDMPILAAAVGFILGVDPLVGDDSNLLAETSPTDGIREEPLLTMGSKENWGWWWLVVLRVDLLVGGITGGPPGHHHQLFLPNRDAGRW